jgi:hypothetical protein
MRPVLQTLLLAVLLLPLAGCVHKADTAVPDAGAASTGGLAGGAVQAVAAIATAAPAWSLGQSWVHKWTVAAAGNITFLVRTVVAEQADGGWTLATDNQTIAAFHGAFVFPTLGHFSRDLLQTVGDTRFPWYHFPLRDNQTWTDSVVVFDGTKDTTLDVQAHVTSATHGASDIYRIELAAKGHVVAAYDYDSATQWFNEARFYDEAGGLQFRIEMQETGHGFKGRLFDDVGSLLLNHQDLVVPAAAIAQPTPPEEFAMAADQNRLLLFLISFAAGGGHDSEVVAPDGTRYGAQAFDAAVSPISNDSRLLLVPGQAGTWRSVAAGAGVFVAGGYIGAYGLRERAIDL